MEVSKNAIYFESFYDQFIDNTHAQKKMKSIWQDR